MAGSDAIEMVVAQLEDMRDVTKEIYFLFVDQPVGLGDMEQTIKDIFQNRSIRFRAGAQS